jgi:hypothetical protein
MISVLGLFSKFHTSMMLVLDLFKKIHTSTLISVLGLFSKFHTSMILVLDLFKKNSYQHIDISIGSLFKISYQHDIGIGSL